MKNCKKCKTEKPLSCFSKSSQKKDGLHLWCKDCNKVSFNAWKINNNERVKNYKLKTRYGITREQYYNMLIQQNNACKICKRDKSEFKKDLLVDHDHNTGKVRGLLCNRCNLCIGKFEDSVMILKSAIEYLES